LSIKLDRVTFLGDYAFNKTLFLNENATDVYWTQVVPVGGTQGLLFEYNLSPPNDLRNALLEVSPFPQVRLLICM
jgi:hypothetical protein